jgi:hypothetical protein
VCALEAIDILLGPAMCDLSLVWIQPSCCHRTVWQEEHQGYRPGEGDEAEDDKEPSPSSDPVVNLANGIA